MSRLWDKGTPLDEQVLRYTAGEDFVLDARLVGYDVRASVAHGRMLEQQGLLSAPDAQAICETLEQLGKEHAAGEWSIRLEDEDVHTALETRLTDKLGDVGGRLHFGRSRNDQVLAALRLYLLDVASAISQDAAGLADVLDKVAAAYPDMPLPGYTHMQPAMPSSVAAWALGYAGEIRDDAAGIVACRRRISRNPLGSAAGYGVPGVPLDREATRVVLGFDTVHDPVTAVQLARGKAEAQMLFELTLLVQDLGRLASDLLLFNTREFGYVVLPATLTTGSSIMPQKRNPDVLELARGAGATLQASLSEVLALPAKLTSGYQRDLQRLKAPLFRGIDLAADTLGILTHTLPQLRFEPANIHMHEELYATEQANKLVIDEGIPFRDAYRRVARQLARKAPD